MLVAIVVVVEPNQIRNLATNYLVEIHSYIHNVSQPFSSLFINKFMLLITYSQK